MKEKGIQNAETAIVYANNFRQEFHDAKQALNDAEKFFFEHEFEKAAQISLETIKRIDPKYR